MVEMGEISFATRMREVVRRIVKEEINRERPGIQYGIVQSYNRATRKASVILAGDVSAINVGMGAIQPSANGQRVRVEGPRGDKYITDVLGAQPYVDMTITVPLVQGGSYASGGGNGDSGTTTITNLNADLRSGWYEIGPNATGAPPANAAEWWLVQVIRHTNRGNNHSRQVAYLMTGATLAPSVDMVYTRRSQAGGTAFAAAEWSPWTRISSNADATMLAQRATHLAHNAGTNIPTKWDGTSLDWQGRVISLGGGGRPTLAADAFWSFDRPATGTSTPGYGGAAARSWTATGLAINNHEALYGVPNSYGAAAGAVTFAVVGYTGNFEVPPHWVLLAHRSELDGRVWTAWQGLIDTWRTPSLVNGWIQYGDTNWGVIRYRKDADGYVHFKGMIGNGTAGATAFTLPVGYRPGHAAILSGVGDGSFKEVRIHQSGDVQPQQGASWLSFSSLAPFRAEN